MTELDDAQLRRELRELLGSRDPGEAPLVLRERVARVPDEVPGRRASASARLARRALAAIPPIAAGFLLLLAVAWLSGVRPLPGPASIPPAEPSPVPFDPTLEGPGIVASGIDGLWPLVGLAVVVLVVLAAWLRGRRRAIPLGIAGALVAGGLVLSSVPPPSLGLITGPGGGVLVVEPPRGSSSQQALYYITAEPRQPFWFVRGVSNEAPLPVHLDGVAVPGPEVVVFPRWTALWRDEEPNLGVRGPGLPFAGADLEARGAVMLWFVARTDSCAMGSAFHVADADKSGYYIATTIKVRWSVLGWPRESEVPLGIDLAEPIREGECHP